MEYDKNKYKVIKWTDWQMINWFLNPGLAINELIFGQRLPQIMLIEKQVNEDNLTNRLIPCPHCGTIHNENLWSQKKAFKNWFGLYCPSCGKTIPCIRNFISLVFLVLTAPLWIWFVKKWKQEWITKQPKRFDDNNLGEQGEENAEWLKIGLSWAGLMYILSIFVNPLITGEEISVLLLLIGIPIWTIGGLCLGYVLKNLNWRFKTT